jgi:uncharacterized spore protein YtfJ
MRIDAVLGQAHESMTVRRVFGDPIERDGVTVIPVANVMGGGGGGGGEESFSAPDMPGGAGSAAEGVVATDRGSGAGFGVRATPAGVYVIANGEVSWQPAMDLTRVAIMGQIVAIVFLLVVRSVLKSRTKD